MESEAAEKQVTIGVDAAKRVKSLPKIQDGDTRSLPSPPSSVKAAELDIDRNADGSLSAEFAGSGGFVSANGGASTGTKEVVTIIEMEADRHISWCRK